MQTSDTRRVRFCIREFALKLKKSKLLIATLLVILGITSVGCRRGPSEEPPRLYKREIARIQKEEARKAAEKAEKERPYMPDRYPWRGTRDDQHLQCIPCRLAISEKCLSARIEYLTEVVHGKKKCRIKFRD